MRRLNWDLLLLVWHWNRAFWSVEEGSLFISNGSLFSLENRGPQSVGITFAQASPTWIITLITKNFAYVFEWNPPRTDPCSNIRSARLEPPFESNKLTLNSLIVLITILNGTRVMHIQTGGMTPSFTYYKFDQIIPRAKRKMNCFPRTLLGD